MKTFGKPSALISCVIVVSFLFDWGDGNLSEWIGPVPSGGTVSAAHTWASISAYDVRVKAKDDTAGRESDWSAAHTITIVEAPILKIYWISGGLFTVKTLIWNNGGCHCDERGMEYFSFRWCLFIGKEPTG